jgi:hypothetical protein
MINNRKLNGALKTPASNGRSGVMAAVTPQKVPCENESLYSPAPSGQHVRRQRTMTQKIDNKV